MFKSNVDSGRRYPFIIPVPMNSIEIISNVIFKRLNIVLIETFENSLLDI